ncbi:MAG: DNA polymerase III subunit delta' [Elusimicrobiota bacterium]
MFKNIINQQKAKDITIGQLKSGRVPHAYLFLGQEGVGRKKFALELAKILNCAANVSAQDGIQNTGGACGHCPSCSKIDRGLHPDVQLVNFEWQANLENKDVEKQKSIKINTIREVQKGVSLKPSEGKWKVYIIEPAEKITLDAANCLLKTLEEPPKWTLLILLARNRENLPATVVSRTQIIPFTPLKETEVAQYLARHHSLSESAAAKIAARSEGSFLAAAALVEEDSGMLESLWNDIKKNLLADAELLAVSQQHSKNASEFTRELLALVKMDFNRDPEKYRNAVQEVLASDKLLGRNVNAQMVLDNMLLSLNHGSK